MGRITVNKQTTQFFTQLEITPTEAIVTAKIKEKYGKITVQMLSEIRLQIPKKSSRPPYQTL